MADWLKKEAWQTHARLLQATAKLSHGAPYFVQVGAHDGYTMDPLYSLIRHFGWSGIRIEPDRALFTRLCELHRDDKNIILENVAVTSKKGRQKFYRLEQKPDGPVWETMIGTLSKEIFLGNKKAVPDFDLRRNECEVECDTLANILNRHGVSRVDVFAIDAEGSDFEIIKQIDLGRHSTAAVLYEHKHLGDAKTECERFFLKNGFRPIELGHADTIAIREDFA